MTFLRGLSGLAPSYIHFLVPYLIKLTLPLVGLQIWQTWNGSKNGWTLFCWIPYHRSKFPIMKDTILYHVCFASLLFILFYFIYSIFGLRKLLSLCLIEQKWEPNSSFIWMLGKTCCYIACIGPINSSLVEFYTYYSCICKQGTESWIFIATRDSHFVLICVFIYIIYEMKLRITWLVGNACTWSKLKIRW